MTGTRTPKPHDKFTKTDIDVMVRALKACAKGHPDSALYAWAALNRIGVVVPKLTVRNNKGEVLTGSSHTIRMDDQT